MRAQAALTIVLAVLVASAPARGQDAPPDELADETLASPFGDPDDQGAPPPPAPLDGDATDDDDDAPIAPAAPANPADPGDEGLAPAVDDRDEAAGEDGVDEAPRSDDGYGYEREDRRKGKKRPGRERRGREDDDPEGGPPVAGVSPLIAGLASAGGAALGLALPVVVLAASGGAALAVGTLLSQVAPQVAALAGIFVLPLYGAPVFLLLGLATGGVLGALPFIDWWKAIIAGGSAALAAILVYFVGGIVGALVGGIAGGVLGFAYLATVPPTGTGLEILVPLFFIAAGFGIGALAGPLLAGPAGVLTSGTVTYIAAVDDGYE